MFLPSVTSTTTVVPLQSSPARVGSDTFKHAPPSNALHRVKRKTSSSPNKTYGSNPGRGKDRISKAKNKKASYGKNLKMEKPGCTSTLMDDSGALYVAGHTTNTVCEAWRILSLDNCDIFSATSEDIWAGITRPTTYNMISNNGLFNKGGVASTGPTNKTTQDCITDTYVTAVEEYKGLPEYIGRNAGVGIGAVAAAAALIDTFGWLIARKKNQENELELASLQR